MPARQHSDLKKTISRLVKNPRGQTFAEELGNSITHGTGLLLSIAALVLLIRHAVHHGTVLAIVSLAVYGTSLVFMYTTSFLYHTVRNPAGKRILHKLDHIAIYVLIAGTYTPIAVLFLPEATGQPVLIAIWSMAVIGIVFKTFFMGRFRVLSVIFYLAMGWLAILAFLPVFDTLPTDFFHWILIGGVFYSAGVLFFAWKEMPFHHSIWHLFVIGGSAAHFIAIFRLLPA